VERPIWIVQRASSGNNARKSRRKERSVRSRDGKARIVCEQKPAARRLIDKNEKDEIRDERESVIPNTGN
jgi:hypothetical protein